eukprot:15141-Pelagomonas_calceolata.AAC.2
MMQGAVPLAKQCCGKGWYQQKSADVKHLEFLCYFLSLAADCCFSCLSLLCQDKLRQLLVLCSKQRLCIETTS